MVSSVAVHLEESVRNGLIVRPPLQILSATSFLTVIERYAIRKKSTVVCGLVSAIAAFWLFLFLLNRVLGMARNKMDVEPITYAYLALLFWDTITALGMMINVRWVVLHGIELGHFCTSQALIQQLSSTGGALSIVAISFCILYNHVISPERPLPLLAGPIGILLMITIQVIDIGVPNAHFGYLHYYGFAGYWCWISDPYLTQKIATEYLFFWLGAVFFLVTAFIFAFARYGLRLRVGLVWLGFIKGDRLFRVGLFSLDSKSHSNPKFNLSIRCESILGVIDFIPIQYFDAYNTATAMNDNLEFTTDVTDHDLPVNKELEAAPTYMSTIQEPTPITPSTTDNTRRGEPMSAVTYTIDSDPDVDRVVERIYAAPNGPDYQVHPGPPLVPNRRVPPAPSDGTESVSSAQSAGSSSAESPLKLLLFPLAYFFIIAPLSISRFLEFSHKNIPAGWVFFGASWFSMQGFVDVMLWKFARPAFGIDYEVKPLIGVRFF